MHSEPTSSHLSLPTITSPPVPADCDMTGLEYMPVYVEQLQGSRTWLRAQRDPRLGFFAFNLWCRAFKQRPAGSLEDCDEVLMDAARCCDPSVWDEVKGELMRGWLRCSSDGRLYHPIVCKIASDVWATRTAYRESMARARVAKAAKRRRDSRQTDLDLGPKGRRRRAPVETWATPAADEDGMARAESKSAAACAPSVESASACLSREPAESQPLDIVDSLSACVDNETNAMESANESVLHRSDADHEPLFKCEVRSEKGGSPPYHPPQNTRGSRLPDSWEPGAAACMFAASLGLDPDDMGQAFADHYRSAPGMRGRSLDWDASWREWCRGAKQRRQGRGEKAGKFDWCKSDTRRMVADIYGASPAM